jgi:hypothetical protein
MEQEPIAIIDCCTDGDEVGLEGKMEHRILAERPCLPKRKHSIITLQTTTILRISSSESISNLSSILSVTEPVIDESAAKDDKTSSVFCEEKCTLQPCEVLESSIERSWALLSESRVHHILTARQLILQERGHESSSINSLPEQTPTGNYLTEPFAHQVSKLFSISLDHSASWCHLTRRQHQLDDTAQLCTSALPADL